MKRFEFTYQSLVDATGLSLESIRSGANDLRDALRSGDLVLLAERISVRTRVKSRRLTDEEIGRLLGERKLSMWERRFPRFDIWRCARDDCRAVLFNSGRCVLHGGDPPLIRFDANLYFEVLVGRKYVPLHRLMCGEPKGSEVHHIDVNKWNNRIENLQILSPEEHRQHHAETAAGQERRRGPAKFTYTCEEIGSLTGLTAETVRKLARDRRLPSGKVSVAKVNLHDLRSVVSFILSRAALAAGGDMGKAAAELGVSRATLYRRAKGYLPDPGT